VDPGHVFCAETRLYPPRAATGIPLYRCKGYPLIGSYTEGLILYIQHTALISRWPKGACAAALVLSGSNAFACCASCNWNYGPISEDCFCKISRIFFPMNLTKSAAKCFGAGFCFSRWWSLCAWKGWVQDGIVVQNTSRRFWSFWVAAEYIGTLQTVIIAAPFHPGSEVLQPWRHALAGMLAAWGKQSCWQIHISVKAVWPWFSWHREKSEKQSAFFDRQTCGDFRILLLILVTLHDADFFWCFLFLLFLHYFGLF
jgi:hypothetical protein